MKTLKDMLSHDRFAAEAGVELLEVREGYAKARMLVTDKHLNGGRSVSGRGLVHTCRPCLCCSGKQPQSAYSFA